MLNFPEPSILEKLKAFDPDSIPEITSRAEEKQNKQFENDRKLITRFQSDAFWRVFFFLFSRDFWRSPTDTLYSASAANSRDAVSKAGAIVKKAVIEYMKAKDITPSDIGLTPAEIDDLGWTDHPVPDPEQRPNPA